MADYSRYMADREITQTDMVTAISGTWPSFSKVQMSFCTNPHKYAVELIPAAEDVLVEKFGAGPGLSISPKLRKKERYPVSKSKPNQLCVRLNDATRSRMQAVLEQMAFASVQDFLEAAVVEFCNRHERGAFRFASPKSK